MQTPVEYINKTAGAVRKLFEGINAYSSILRLDLTPVFSTPYTAGENFPTQQFEIWNRENSAKLSAARKAKEEYLVESFAHATLCGAVLQIAAKALECYSKNSVISGEFSSLIKPATTNETTNADVVRYKQLIGKAVGPKCATCPLPCVAGTAGSCAPLQ